MEQNYKGVGVVFVRERVRLLEPDARAAFHARLSEDERLCLDDTLATHWVPVEHASRLFEVLAEVSHADHETPLREVGRQLARHDLSGVYRLLIRVATVRFLLTQHTRLWSVYHRTGEASLVEHEPGHVTIRIAGHPTLPSPFRVAMAGWLIGAMELCGAKDIQALHEPDHAPPWRFEIRWR